VSESISQIHIKKVALFRVDARIGLFLCCPGQGWPYGGRGSRVPFLVGRDVIKDIRKFIQGKHH